jgi:hypothetical protein
MRLQLYLYGRKLLNRDQVFACSFYVNILFFFFNVLKNNKTLE